MMKYSPRHSFPPELMEHALRSDRGQVSRLMFSGLIGLLALIALEPLWVLAWFILVYAWDLQICPRLIDHFALRADGASVAVQERRIGFISGWIGASLYALFPLALAWQGSTPAVFIAFAWVSGGAIHCFVYFSRARALLIAHLAPGVVFFCIGIFLGQGPTLAAVVMVVVLGCNLYGASIFAADRNVLLHSLDSEIAARRAADEANTAKSQFLATMSHELRTPLNAVIGYAEIIQEDIAEGRMPATLDAERIRASAKHLLSLINEVLDISKLEADRVVLDPEPTDLPVLLAQARDTLAPLAEKNHNSLQLIVQPGIGLATLDPQRLMQCLLNLGSNACKFTNKGRISIIADTLREDGVVQLRVKVIDTGIGIDEHAAQNLFTPFMQADGGITRKFGGTGLGLAITRRLARQMGGDVAVTSTPGVGSTFTLTVAAQPVETIVVRRDIDPSPPHSNPTEEIAKLERRTGLGML